jgi:S-DNA-T family DNA segregation ATPase FtsK/SpoIIIE
MLEFEMYHDIPHLIHPVITDSNLATGILKWACDEMDSRYALMAKFKTRTIMSFNKRLEKELKDWTPEKAKKLAPIGWNGKGAPPKPKKMPYIVVVIDELADLMMVAGKDVESSIIRIAQKARACGIHLIVATQRPSVDVITGMIKANMPCRISFQVRQRTDSRTILYQNGGENLLGRGDMLFLPPGISSLLRCHGPFISDDEVRRVTDFLRAQAKPTYDAKVIEAKPQAEENANKDELYDLTVEYIASMGKASTSMIQRKFRIGYNRAARLMDTMEEEGLIGPADGAKPRKVFAKPIV